MILEEEIEKYRQQSQLYFDKIMAAFDRIDAAFDRIEMKDLSCRRYHPCDKTDDNCLICLDDCATVKCDDCDHPFHPACLLKWHATSATCPVCRKI